MILDKHYVTPRFLRQLTAWNSLTLNSCDILPGHISPDPLHHHQANVLSILGHGSTVTVISEGNQHINARHLSRVDQLFFPCLVSLLVFTIH